MRPVEDCGQPEVQGANGRNRAPKLTSEQRGRAALASRFHGGWKRIGPRLLVGMLLVIVPTGLIGAVAVQRFNGLAVATTELSTRDLPEIVTVDHLRHLLFQQIDLERGHQLTSNEFRSGRSLLLGQRAKLLAYEPPDPPLSVASDTALVQRLNRAVLLCASLGQHVGQLLLHGHAAQANVLYRREMTPALQTALAGTAHLRVKEEQEAATASALVQQQSQMATKLVLTLTLISLLLSILLAVALSRSLTRPLAALLRATGALAAGDLTASPKVKSDDEIGQVARAFDVMRSNLSSMIAALEQERRQTQAIFDASHDGVMLVDGQQRVVQLNPAAERLSGRLAAEAMGEEWWKVFGCSASVALELNAVERAGFRGRLVSGHEREGQAVDSSQAVLFSPQAAPEDAVMRGELLSRSPDGGERWLAVSSAPVAQNGDSRARRTVLNFHDISELKILDELKSDFVAMVSHELRAPLTTVTGAVEMLVATDLSKETSTYGEIVAILEQQTRRLRTVIDEVLQVTRLEARQVSIRLEPLDLTPFLQRLIEVIRNEWREDVRPVTVQAPDTPTWVWADRRMLEIVISNLLDNARKYTPLGSAIEIEILAGTQVGLVQLHVVDHGPGIPQDQMEHVFDRFSRGAQSSYNWTRGYGLGLYFARELIRAHDGEIRVENRRDGACFIISLHTVEQEEMGEDVPQSEAL